MLGRIFRHLQRNLVAYVALFFGLAGTSFGAATLALPANSVGTKQLKKNAVTAKKIHANAITSTKVKDNTITGADVNEASLEQVPASANADRLDGIDSTGFARPGTEEAWHEIGAPGQPAFQNGWFNQSPNFAATAAYYKDPFDVVHLKGEINGGSAFSTIFTLPAGYRSSRGGCLATERNAAIATVCFYPNGDIRLQNGSGVNDMLLDGLTFRVGS
jgi:hypothetical protein